MVKRFLEFTKEEIWRIRFKELPKAKYYLLRPIQILLVTIRGFDEDKCMLRASALTFYTLISIVPVLAVIFAFAKGFGLQEKLQEKLMSMAEGQEQAAQKIMEFSQNMLEQADGGVIAGVGILFLFWAIIKVLGHIENAFNHIWGVTKPRTFGRKVGDYLAFILICPILMLTAVSATATVQVLTTNFMEKYQWLQTFGPIVKVGLKICSLLIIWVLFAFIYYWMPNTKVSKRAGLIGAIIAGIMFQIFIASYLGLQVGMAKANAIYGSFAALPLMLILLQFSWVIILFGGEISFACQNVKTYEFEKDCLEVSPRYRRKLSLLIAHRIIKHFCEKKPPEDVEAIEQALNIPVRLVRKIVFDLVQAGILIEIKDEESARKITYQPACDVALLTIKSIHDALDEFGRESLPVNQTEELKRLEELLDQAGQDLENSEANICLKDI